MLFLVPPVLHKGTVLRHCQAMCYNWKRGDFVEHKEYIRINYNANTAILFIHGILGTPNHFNEFVALVPPSVSVYNVLLDGHGKGIKDFSKTSMKKWEEQITTAVEMLSGTHQQIYIAAHSLGTLLAMAQAAKNRKITKLFLLAVPLKLSLKYKMVANSWKVYFNKIRSDDVEAIAAKNCCGVAMGKNPFSYFGWIPRFLELFAKIRSARSSLSTLEVPCVAYQSTKDELVSGKSILLLEQNPRICVKELKHSGHYYYDKSDWNFLLDEFGKMIKDEA